MSDYTLVHGDCLEAMRAMEAGGVDAIVTDPPYGLRFMGKRWDYDVPGVDTFREMLRLLPDGGRLLCFAGARTAHRMTVNIEDAGFIIEDVVMWLYGSGFPKHKSKLKPAYEPIVVARKGGASELNIDAGRIGTGEDRTEGGLTLRGSIWGGGDGEREARPTGGRWPANVALDDEAARALDEMSGELHSQDPRTRKNGQKATRHGVSTPFEAGAEPLAYADSGGASRFFYTAKAPRAEREHGLEGASRKRGGSTVDGFTEDKAKGNDRNRPVANHHPTVKPVDLMRWLVRLVAKPGQTVLDPFMGSGTTGVACTLEGVGFVGVEREAEYVDIARRRIVATQPNLFSEGAA